jgi:hypothetical protein
MYKVNTMFTIIAKTDTYIKPSKEQSKDIPLVSQSVLGANKVISALVLSKDGNHIKLPSNRFVFNEHVTVKSSDDYIGINPAKVPLLSQRDFNKDNNRDGKNDAFQTCNIHSVAMVVEAITGKPVDLNELDKEVIKLPGSRYSHNNLVLAMNKRGVKSNFSTTMPVTKLFDWLGQGKCAIWSNKLTHGGHLVVIAGYNTKTKQFLIFDPYGEPSKVGTKWTYKPSKEPYWLSKSGFESATANTADKHWLHLVG